MRLALAKSVFVSVLAGVMLSAAPPVCGESVFDKLKKQAKDSLDQNKKQAQKTVEDSAGVDTSQSPASYRADLEQKWKACYDQMLASNAYQQCASICNAARQSIADSEPASLGNKATWQRCQDSYGKALASAPAKPLSAKEKAQGLPAGALPGSENVQAATTVGGVDLTNADSLRADTERMRSDCQARRKENSEFTYCANICSQSSQKISSSSSAVTRNGQAWQRCKVVYDGAMGVTQVVSGDTSTPTANPVAKPAATPAVTPAATPAASVKTAQKPAAKPAPKSSLTATAADKAAADKYAQQCAANYHLSGTYDCQCMREKYLAASLVLREENIRDWETSSEPYRRAQIERLKAEGKNPANLQKLYDEEKAGAYGTPNADAVSLKLTAQGGEAPMCYSRTNIVKMQKTECLSGSRPKTTMGTPIDEKYCSCYSEKVASLMIDDQLTGTLVPQQALLACDTESPVYKLKAGK
jgi:hypothetical protein